MDRYAFEPMDDEGRTMSFVAPPLRATDMVAYGSIEDLATTAGISEVSVHLCRMGSFGIWDLVDHMPTLRPLIAEHGERVIERCQLARFNCGSAAQAVDCVLAYYRAPNDASRLMSEQARRALSPKERAAAFVSIGRNPDGSFPAVC